MFTLHPAFWSVSSDQSALGALIKFKGTSLVVQWVRLHAPNAGGTGSIRGWRTGSHMLQRKPGTA